jgi:hypothetical protein
MARNGSGTFVRLYDWTDERDAGNNIDSTKMDAEMDGMATALSGSIAADGQTTITANLPMATYKHTGVGAASASTDYARADQVRDSSLSILGSVSGTDTITAAASPAISAYAAGQTFRFVAAGANTGAVTLNVNSVGAKAVTKAGTTALVAGDIPANSIATVVYDGTRFQLLPMPNITAAAATVLDDASTGDMLTTLAAAGTGTANTFSEDQVLSGDLTVSGTTTLATADSTDPFAPRSYLAGLGLSNGTDSDHDIDIAAGMCRDGGDAATLRLTSAITKQIDAAWSVGDDAGGIDTGAVANNTWYAIWLIRRSDTGVVDALFSTSASSPTMPTNYDQKRRIGWVRTNGSANIIGFLQTGDTFEWTDPNTNGLDESDTAVTTSESTITLDFVPPSVESILHAVISGTELAAVWLYRTDLTSAAITIASGVLPNVGSRNVNSGQTNRQAGAIRVRTDSSRQIHARAQGSYTLDVQSMGWADRRGRDD